MKKIILVLLLIVLVLISGCAKELEEEPTQIPPDKKRGNPYPSLNFEIDCSRLSNESQDDCQTFIYNQENILYPEMKRITGIDLRWCYDTIRHTIYTPEESLCGPSAGGCIGPGSTGPSEEGIAYLPKFSINSKCKMDSHELQHIFDFCIHNYYPLIELMTIVGGRAQKNVCPEYKYPYNLASLMEGRIVKNDDFEVKDCFTAQGYIIYNSNETFIHKFYERLLQKNLSESKTESDITEAIIYASNNETDYYIKKYCFN